MQELIVRHAFVRFIFFSHPGLDALLGQDELDQKSGLEVLDDAAVNVFYRFSRGIEQALDLLRQVHVKKGGLAIDEFEHHVLLMKV